MVWIFALWVIANGGFMCFKQDIAKLASTLPSACRDDYKREVAQSLLLRNTMTKVDIAYDSLNGLRNGNTSTRDASYANAWLDKPQITHSQIAGTPPRGRLPPQVWERDTRSNRSKQNKPAIMPGNFLRGYGGMNQMPPQDPMMSSRYSRNGNGNGNGPNRHTNANALDQVELEPQNLLDFVQLCLRHFQDDEDQQAELAQGLADIPDSEINGEPAQTNRFAATPHLADMPHQQGTMPVMPLPG
jgi:hypothetical protein